ncbi:hypothetical protein MMC34_003236 [Xylographa carneopallida]|nr:hypothetical protein [Xylographa carneopallida]
MSGGATNPYKRPRLSDHGVRSGAAQEMDFVNSTMTQFLGGKKKSWMTGQQCEGRRPSQHEAIQQNPIYTRPAAFQPPRKESTTRLPPGAANSIHAQFLSANLQPRTVQAVAQEQNTRSERQNSTAPDPSLPSPSPSDDAQHVTDVDVDHRQPTFTERGQRSTNPISVQEYAEHSTRQSALTQITPNAEKLLSLAEKYGGIDELQRRLEATESATQIRRTSMDTSQSMPQSGSNALYTLTGTGSTHSHNPLPAAPNITGNAVDSGSSNNHANMYGSNIDLLAAGLQFLLPAICTRIESVRRAQTPGSTGPLEESRLRLLHIACESGDVFYLVLHQMYCLYNTPGFFSGCLNLNENQIKGLMVVEELVLPNKALMNESIMWLSSFPQSFESLLRLSSIYQTAYSDVRRCLELLGQGWFQFKRVCVTRKSLPLVDYMDSDLGVKSTVLQQVIFTALHRLLWSGSHDVCSVKSATLFKDNQQVSQQWHLRCMNGNPPSKDEMSSYYQRLVAQYQYLQNCHVQHLHGILPTTNGTRQTPSTMRPPPTHSASSSSTHQPRGVPTPILPSSGWSISGLATPVQSPVTATSFSNTLILPDREHHHQAGNTSQQRPVPSPTRTDHTRNDHTRTLVPPPLSVAISQTQSGLDYHNPPQRSNLLPIAGFSLQYNGQPLDNTALHQAHLREPDFAITRADHEAKDSTYFQYFRELAVGATLIRPKDRNVYFHFPVSPEILATIAKDELQPQGAANIRIVQNKSHVFRLRCIKVAHIDKQSKVPWLSEETSWPKNAVFVCNDTHLELRRKAHYGKDLPVDITGLVKEGDNTLHVAIIRVGPLAVDTDPTFAVAVEIIEIGNLSTVKGYIRHDEMTMIERIKTRLKPTDSDVEVLNGDIIVDINDPYSSSLITTPARGASCRHYECFDLDNFLGTRLGSPKGSPCQPEQFRCPICNGDARPESLVLDQWFCEVLAEIRRRDRLDARSIIIDASGAWRIKEVEVEGESGDGTGQRKRVSVAPVDARRASRPIENEVIEID